MMIGMPGKRATSSLATTESISLRSNSLGGVEADPPLALSPDAGANGDEGETLTGLPRPRVGAARQSASGSHDGTRSCPGNRILGRRNAQATPLIERSKSRRFVPPDQA